MYGIALKTEKKGNSKNLVIRAAGHPTQRTSRPGLSIQRMKHMEQDSDSAYDYMPTQYNPDQSAGLNNPGHTVQRRISIVRAAGMHPGSVGNNVVQRCNIDDTPAKPANTPSTNTPSANTPSANTPPANNTGAIVPSRITKPLKVVMTRQQAAIFTDMRIDEEIKKINEGLIKYKPAKICVVAHLPTHELFVGFNGKSTYNPYRINDGEMVQELRVKLKKTRDLAKQKNKKDSFESWDVDNCAEVPAVNQALRKGASWKNLYMNTRDYKPDFSKVYALPCGNCKRTFDGIPTSSPQKGRY